MSIYPRLAKICVFTDRPVDHCETFIRAHTELLPGKIVSLYGSSGGIRDVYRGDGTPLISSVGRIDLVRLAAAKMFGSSWSDIRTALLSRYLTVNRIDVVLAEFGQQGVAIMEACSATNVPLVVHFHGFDAYRQDVLTGIGRCYPRLFEQARAIVAVSRAMEVQLLQLGAPRDKLHCNPYGVDLSVFRGAEPGEAPPRFLSVGRFVDKKAPDLTLLAFKLVTRAVPTAHLTMIGDGPLWWSCRRLVEHLGMSDSVDLLGQCSHQQIADAMRQARVYVQHSMQAGDGDSEGTPLAILEASASGLPVVSTRHGGIPDVVVEGHTGYLVKEGDVDGMAAGMIRLARSADMASKLGIAARQQIREHFSVEKSMEGLWSIVESVI